MSHPPLRCGLSAPTLAWALALAPPLCCWAGWRSRCCWGSLPSVRQRLFAQVEGERGILPIATSSDIEVSGIEVNATGKDAEEARLNGWRQAQRKGWEKLGGPAMADGVIDSMVSAVVIEREQIGPRRYVANAGRDLRPRPRRAICWRRARARARIRRRCWCCRCSIRAGRRRCSKCAGRGSGPGRQFKFGAEPDRLCPAIGRGRRIAAAHRRPARAAAAGCGGAMCSTSSARPTC